MKTSLEDDISAIQLLDEPVRRRLYEWVVAQGRPVGRDESARALGIGRALATFHLDRLATGGLLAGDYRRLTEKRGPGAGRPARVYWRADRDIEVTLPERRYERMADLLATVLESNASLGDVAEAVGERLAAAAPDSGSGRDGLLHVLQDSGYEPVPGPDGTIRLRNCPFHALIAQHQPLVCSANVAMARGITRASGADAGLSPVLEPQAGYCCVVFKPTDSQAG